MLIWEQTLENQVNGGFCSWYLCKWALVIRRGSADGSPHITADVSRAIWSPAFMSVLSLSPASVGMALQSELLEYGMWFWFTFAATLEEWQGLSALTLKKMVKRPTVFWAFVLVGFLCTFLPGYCILSFSQALLCLSQHLCMYVPSHPLEQVGASMAGPKTEHCRGAWPSPASHGGAVPADVSLKCYGSVTRGDSQQ